MTDRLTLTRALEQSGMESQAAERIATENHHRYVVRLIRRGALSTVGSNWVASDSRLISRISSLVPPAERFGEGPIGGFS